MPKFTKLIAVGRARTKKEIRATRYPYFNLIRLVKEPCARFKCTVCHNNPFNINAPMKWIFVCLIVGMGCACWFNSATLAYATLAVMAFLIVHLLYEEDWEAHKGGLAQLREPLLERTDGDHLTDELVREVAAFAERLFGPGSDYTNWLAMIEQRVQEVGSETEVVTENAAELEGLREPAVRTHVRIIPDDADVISALSALRAFKTGAENELSRLRTKANELKAPVNNVRRLRAMSGADTTANTKAIERTIQDVTDHIFTSLKALSLSTSVAIQTAALATGGNYASSAKKIAKTTAEDAEDPAKNAVTQRRRGQ